MNKISHEISIKTVSEANSSEHWAVKSKRHKQQQLFVRLAMVMSCEKVTLPCVVTLTRLSPGVLDDDNLRSAFKYIRDEISEILIPILSRKIIYSQKTGKVIQQKGRSDNDPRIKWEYAQEKSIEKKIRIDIAY